MNNELLYFYSSSVPGWTVNECRHIANAEPLAAIFDCQVMQALSLIIISLFLCSCNNVGSIRSNHQPIALTENELSNLFMEGQHNASLVTNKQLTTEQKKALRKFYSAIRDEENIQDAFDSISKKPNPGQLRDLRKKWGMSKDEFELLLAVFNKPGTSSEKGTVSISRTKNQITFKGTGNLSILDSLTINFNDSSAIFKQSKLDHFILDSSYRSNQFLPSGETLEMIYAFTGPNNVSGLLPTSNRYILVVGRVGNSKNTYLYLKVKEQFDIDKPFDRFYSITLL